MVLRVEFSIGGWKHAAPLRAPQARLFGGHWRWLQGIGTTADLRRCHAITNVIERDDQLKRAWGFPDEHFTRVHDILRKPALVA